MVISFGAANALCFENFSNTRFRSRHICARIILSESDISLFVTFRRPWWQIIRHGNWLHLTSEGIRWVQGILKETIRIRALEETSLGHLNSLLLNPIWIFQFWDILAIISVLLRFHDNLPLQIQNWTYDQVQIHTFWFWKKILFTKWG